jgi:hypothetical protein
MNKFKVRVYEATGWSFLTQGDHYEDYTFTTEETLERFAKRLAREGFLANESTWIMPGAIVWCKAI